MTSTKKILYHVDIADDDVGEVEGFFDEQGNLLHCWSMNDALWRSEYLNPLLEELGYTVKHSGASEFLEKLRKQFI
jgi:hypothetical protein